MAEDAEYFAYTIKQLLAYVTTPVDISVIPENLARIPLLWSIDFLWNSVSDMIIRANRDDDITLTELASVVVGFSTARQFNEAVFIDVERSVI